MNSDLKCENVAGINVSLLYVVCVCVKGGLLRGNLHPEVFLRTLHEGYPQCRFNFMTDPGEIRLEKLM